MNDEFKGKSGKVRVMYVREEEAQRPGGQNPRTGKGGRPAERQEKPRRASGDDSRKPRNGDDFRKSRSGDDARKSRSSDDFRGSRGDSPWRTVSRAPSDEATSEVQEAPRHIVDPEQIRRQRQEETRVYGENACQALFQHRPESIVRAWFVQSVTPRFREALRWMAANRKAYHVVNDDELAKASGTEHHGGVCFIIKKRLGMAVSDWLAQADEKDCVLALEDVSNPHNLGGIMRSCAHFGVKGLLVNDASLLESGAAVRTAEGGAEHVKAISGESFAEGLEAFRRAGYTIVTTSSHQGTPLAQAQLPAKMVLVLGQEREGLSDSTFQQGDMSLSIGGTGRVESLNVSVATGVLLAEWWRQNA
ncbi:MULTISPECIES: tRNA/rRNA methyltransferase [Pantoea]|uniref:tRNA/rRNA methyltransferase n=1 Tax=Candidatus Pantoea multigeneris TaxID=2608357 RepID=A0ABX0R6R3_9GAMM|nr:MULTISPECIES: tRNA/rRNA methyltransferase [Pantoea]NIF21082.1 tRNA/rRNA methyltransferase [Pantoea multigeneris]